MRSTPPCWRNSLIGSAKVPGGMGQIAFIVFESEGFLSLASAQVPPRCWRYWRSLRPIIHEPMGRAASPGRWEVDDGRESDEARRESRVAR